MKLSKEELKNKIVEVVSDEDVQIGLLEDIEDSFVDSNSDENMIEKDAYEDLKIKYEELKAKYKERFLKGEETSEEKEDEDEDEELQEEEVIDIREI